MTFHTQVVGANGQRQAMFIERTPGLAEVILANFTFGPHDVMMVFSASGAMPPVITRASVVGADRSRDLFEDAYREHARRLARAIVGER